MECRLHGGAGIPSGNRTKRVLPFYMEIASCAQCPGTWLNSSRRKTAPTAVGVRSYARPLIIVVCIVAITALGSNANQTFSYVASNTQPAAVSS